MSTGPSPLNPDTSVDASNTEPRGTWQLSATSRSCRSPQQSGASEKRLRGLSIAFAFHPAARSPAGGSDQLPLLSNTKDRSKKFHTLPLPLGRTAPGSMGTKPGGTTAKSGVILRSRGWSRLSSSPASSPSSSTTSSNSPGMAADELGMEPFCAPPRKLLPWEPLELPPVPAQRADPHRHRRQNQTRRPSHPDAPTRPKTGAERPGCFGAPENKRQTLRTERSRPQSPQRTPKQGIEQPPRTREAPGRSRGLFCWVRPANAGNQTCNQPCGGTGGI